MDVFSTMDNAVHHHRLTTSTALVILGNIVLVQSCAISPRPRYTTDRQTKNPSQPDRYSRHDRDASRAAAATDSLALDDHKKADETQAELLPLYNQAQHEKLAASISAYLDARYKYGGNDANAIDCSGFVKAIFQEVYHIELPRKAAEIYRLGSKVGKGSLTTGDLVFFSTAGWRSINHVGIYLSNNKFVHSSTSQGVTISSLDEEYWKRRFRGGRRL